MGPKIGFGHETVISSGLSKKNENHKITLSDEIRNTVKYFNQLMEEAEEKNLTVLVSAITGSDLDYVKGLSVIEIKETIVY
ncbi:hypothetical protein LCGC14_0570490 [marine sediment metagenome]|uniref:Uncharacterized protein n=1 Tax=marine sediment metagenome TaxID=412755 RepID=A0A0F9S325_9ZZZZ